VHAVPGCRSTSAIRRARGNAARTKIPMVCCGNTSRKAPTSAGTPRMNSTPSRTPSIRGRAKRSAGKHPLKPSTKSSQRFISRVLRRPVESALRSAIRVMDQARCGSLPLPGHHQCRQRQLGLHVVAHCPTDDLARRQVEHGREIAQAAQDAEHPAKAEPALSGGDVSDISEPDQVGCRCHEALREQVGRDRKVMPTVSSARSEPASCQRADAMTAHHLAKVAGTRLLLRDHKTVETSCYSACHREGPPIGPGNARGRRPSPTTGKWVSAPFHSAVDT
jgi:hypothetical protein